MPDDPSTPESGEPNIPQVHDENFTFIYANWIQAGRTAWDIALLFGQIRETSPSSPAVVHLLNVVMTPQMAKALVGTLAVTVKQYEQDNGEIVLPNSIKRNVSVKVSSPSPEAGEAKPSLSNPESSQKPFEERPADKPIPRGGGFGQDKS